MTLEIINSNAVPPHQREQQFHGSRDWNVTRGPTADGADIDTKEAGAAHLRQPKRLQGGSEVVGGHGLPTMHQRGQLGRKAHGVDQRIEVVGGLGLDPKDRDALMAHFVGEGLGPLDGVEVEAVFGPVLIEEAHRDFTGQLGHFILQRAWAPFRMTMSKPDILSNVNPYRERLAA